MIERDRLPANFGDFLGASLRRTPESTLREKTRQSRANAETMVKKLAGKLAANDDGTRFLPGPLLRQELELLHCLTSYLTVRPAFTADRLFSDFQATLKSHGLLQRGEMKPFEALKAPVALFAATVMHNCTIQIGDGSSLKLKLGIKTEDVQILATVPFVEAEGEYHLASAIFSSKLKTSDCFAPRLAASLEPWDFDVELTPEGKLDRLG
jgi:hypothetical protein